MSRIYRFWNGKNLDGKQLFADPVVDKATCSNCAFKCVEGTETCGADEL
jgi:hypothetical protein